MGHIKKSEKAILRLSIQKTKIMASSPIIPWQIDEETKETMTDFISWAPKSLQMVTAAMKLEELLSPWKKNYDKSRHHIKQQRHYFADKVSSRQSYDFSSSHVWM